MEEMLALSDCLLDPGREHWERMQAAQDLDTHGPPALPYLFEASALDWSHDPAMLKLIGNSIANIWREAGTLATASTEGLPAPVMDEIQLHRTYL